MPAKCRQCALVLPEAIPRLEVDAAQEREIEKKSEAICTAEDDDNGQRRGHRALERARATIRSRR